MKTISFFFRSGHAVMPVFRKNGHCCTSFFLRSGHRRHPVLPSFRISEVPFFSPFSVIRNVSFSRFFGHAAHSLSPFSGHLSSYFLPAIRTIHILPRPNFYEKAVKIRTIRISALCTLYAAPIFASFLLTRKSFLHVFYENRNLTHLCCSLLDGISPTSIRDYHIEIEQTHLRFIAHFISHLYG